MALIMALRVTCVASQKRVNAMKCFVKYRRCDPFRESKVAYDINKILDATAFVLMLLLTPHKPE
jgi:hypothetical protein